MHCHNFLQCMNTTACWKHIFSNHNFFFFFKGKIWKKLTNVPLGLPTPVKPEYSFCSCWGLNSSSLSFLQSFSSRELDEEEDGEEVEEDLERSCSLFCLLKNKKPYCLLLYPRYRMFCSLRSYPVFLFEANVEYYDTIQFPSICF